MVEDSFCKSTIGGGIHPGSKNPNPVDALFHEGAASVIRRYHAGRVVRETGDDRDSVASGGDARGQLEQPCLGRPDLRWKVMRQESDAEVFFRFSHVRTHARWPVARLLPG